jgi:DNA-directed RNA polymerase specialized sigma24 family protein
MTLKDLEYKLDNYYNHWALKDAINRLNTLKAEYDALYDSSGAINYDGMPHSTTPHEPPLDAVCRMGEQPEKLRAEIVNQRKAILEISYVDATIETALHSLKPPEEEIIHLKHCEGMKFPEIAATLHFSESRAKHKYLSAMYEILYLVGDKKVSTK